MTTYRVADLNAGAELDLAVAIAGEEWKTAHELFPTMTLDPTFNGARIIERGQFGACYLTPSNPMRQDPQPFSPSTDWRIGGPIIEREGINPFSYVHDGARYWAAHMQGGYPTATEGHKSLLVAAMREFVVSKLGDEVELPI